MTAQGVSESEPKLGLALSGGGFRASFFHLGLLARLAELGILRQVEVISTVSGGSIIGALYYLHLKALLENQEERPTRDRYVQMVKDIERDFVSAVRKNIRGRIYLNPVRNAEMLIRPRYSRSDRAGALYERYFYKGAWVGGRDSSGDRIAMRDLRIQPHDATSPFHPDRDNADREAKVPVLLLNATSLNTGHNWRFEAVRMGEPLPADPVIAELTAEVDKNTLLSQGYFDEASEPVPHRAITKKQRDFPLGVAVAASACVPGLFAPLAISSLYGEGFRVQLVDGGVHDNQGVQGLFDTGCTHLIISDASGQMKDQAKPATQIPSVLARSSSIYGARLRDEQLARSLERRASTSDAQIEAVALLHLRTGNDRPVLAPVDDEGNASVQAPPQEPGSADRFVSQRVQRLLAEIRTDLDAFSDTEAMSLMVDAYNMVGLSSTGIAQGRFAQFVEQGDPEEGDWVFLKLQEHLKTDEARRGWYLRSLAAGSKRFFKPLHFRRGAGSLLGVLVVAAIAILTVCKRHSFGDVLTSKLELWPALAIAAGGLALVGLYLTKTPKLSVIRVGLGFVLAVPFALVLSLISLGMLAEGKLFLWLGRVRD